MLRPTLHCVASAYLCACTPSSEPATRGEDSRTTAEKREAPAVTVEPQPTTEPATPARTWGDCAEVGIGLDLRALPTGSDQQDIRWYTLGQADDFEALAPAGVRVELYVADGGISVFDARIYASSESEALRHCREMTEAFIPKVPGHPRTDESGGSIKQPCRPCPLDRQSAEP